MGTSSRGPAELNDGLSFARRLRRARMARKWGQLGLAERMFKVGLEYEGSATVIALKGMISKWERGSKLISQENLHLVAETLGIPVKDLGVWVDPDFVWRKRLGHGSMDEPGKGDDGEGEPEEFRRPR